MICVLESGNNRLSVTQTRVMGLQMDTDIYADWWNLMWIQNHFSCQHFGAQMSCWKDHLAVINTSWAIKLRKIDMNLDKGCVSLNHGVNIFIKHFGMMTAALGLIFHEAVLIWGVEVCCSMFNVHIVSLLFVLCTVITISEKGWYGLDYGISLMFWIKFSHSTKQLNHLSAFSFILTSLILKGRRS